MNNSISKFKDIVIANNSREDFEYREWMVTYHLDIVERIALELCDKHSEANRDIVHVLAWFHDYGKPLGKENERQITRTEGPKVLAECGFSDEFIQQVVHFWELMEQKNEIDLREAPIETQIISSADGASHLVGTFYPGYFGDGDGFEKVQQRLKEKMEKDWNRKIVLPEVKTAFQNRYTKARELLGEFPDRFLN